MDWTNIAGPLLGAIGVIAAAWFGLRGSRGSDRTMGLDKAASWWKEAVERLDADVAALKADRAELRAEHTQLRRDFRDLKESYEDLARENRLYREVLTGVMARLQQMAPDTGRPTLDYIIQHIPWLGKDRDE